jgi:hypothetical protein
MHGPGNITFVSTVLIVTYVSRNDRFLNATTSSYSDWALTLLLFTLYVTAHMHALLDNTLLRGKYLKRVRVAIQLYL